MQHNARSPLPIHLVITLTFTPSNHFNFHEPGNYLYFCTTSDHFNLFIDIFLLLFLIINTVYSKSVVVFDVGIVCYYLFDESTGKQVGGGV